MKCDFCKKPLHDDQPWMSFPLGNVTAKGLGVSNCHVGCGMMACGSGNALALYENLEIYLDACAAILEDYEDNECLLELGTVKMVEERVGRINSMLEFLRDLAREQAESEATVN